MTVPARRIVAGPVAVHGGPAQDALDPHPHPAAVSGFVGPDRLQDPQHQGGVDLRHRQLADHREGVVAQRVAPLLPVLLGSSRPRDGR